MSHLVITQYQGMSVTFRDDGWFNATVVAARFGKEPGEWLKQRETVEYMAALSKRSGKSGIVQEFNKISDLNASSASSRAKFLALAKKTGLVSTKQGSQQNGGGTWLHPKLAVRFAQWLDVDFAVWCDEQIETIMHGDHPHHTWQRLRHQAASSFKVMSDMLQIVRERQGKASKPYHFMNEAKLVNGVLTGKFAGLNREDMTIDQLDLLAQVEQRSAVLIGCGLPYEERKKLLFNFVADWREKHAANIEYRSAA